MWSRTALLVIRLSAAESIVESTFRAALSGVHPLAAALTGWHDDAPVVELFEALAGVVWTMELASGKVEKAQTLVLKSEALAEGATGAGVMRNEMGWMYAQRVVDPFADTSAIVLVGSNSAGPVQDPGVSSPLPAALKMSPRRIDRILHVRQGSEDGALVTEAAFPFTTVEFTPDGIETSRAAPRPDELRDQLGEPDLRYVIATPSLMLDGAALNTFIALRSGRRVSALRLPDSRSVRYREIPGDLSFLGMLRSNRLLVATRSGRPYRLVLFRWRWTDQRQSCTDSPA